jgi:hypothetical protein
VTTKQERIEFQKRERMCVDEHMRNGNGTKWEWGGLRLFNGTIHTRKMRNDIT